MKKKEKTIGVRLDYDMYAWLQIIANSKGMYLSEYMRNVTIADAMRWEKKYGGENEKSRS